MEKSDKAWRPVDWPPPLPYVVQQPPRESLGDAFDWALAGIVSFGALGVFVALFYWHPQVQGLFR